VAQSHQANRAADRVHDELAPYRSRNCSMEHQGDEPDHNMCFSPLWILLFSGEHVKAAPCCIWSFVRIRTAETRYWNNSRRWLLPMWDWTFSTLIIMRQLALVRTSLIRQAVQLGSEVKSSCILRKACAKHKVPTGSKYAEHHHNWTMQAYGVHALIPCRITLP
jgi:hypothetical protein